MLIGLKEKWVKCELEVKIMNLYTIYDLDEDGKINFNEFLTMLYNYPKDALKKIINDEIFVNSTKILDNKQNKKSDVLT